MTTKTPTAPTPTPSVEAPPAIMTGEALQPLTLADRCDSCAQPGQSRWKMAATTEEPLIFCGHHTRRFLAKLRASTPYASLINPGVIA